MKTRVIPALLSLLCAAAVLVLPVAAAEEEMEPDVETAVLEEQSKLTLHYYDEVREEPLSDALFYLYKVGELDSGSADGVYHYHMTDAFAGAGVSLENLKFWGEAETLGALAESLAEYAAGNNIEPKATARTDSDGDHTFSSLEQGLYLVRGETAEVPGAGGTGTTTYTPQTVLVPLPYPMLDGSLNRAVESKVKGEVGPGPESNPGSGSGGGSSNSGSKPATTPSLDTGDHFAYLIGYEDGTIRPDANITRAEAVTIFFRLLTDDVRNQYWRVTNPYPDVEQSAWYNTAISTMTNMGIVEGDPDGTFRPEDSITRAELTKIVVGFFQHTDHRLTGSTRFTDVPQGRWYTRFVEIATELGLIEGYPDHTFRPENAITRAETATIVNRALGRKPHRDGLLDHMITWSDNENPNAWYYADIQEATNSHDFQMSLYASDGTWYYPDDLHSQDFRMGWYAPDGVWNWTDDLRSRDFLLCRHKSDGIWYYADLRENADSHELVICRYNSDGTWSWHYSDDIQGGAGSDVFQMVPYDGAWRYPNEENADSHDFLLCRHKSDGTVTWYFADDLREDAASYDFEMVLYGTDGTYEQWTALLPVRDWAALERSWSELHSTRNYGEMTDRALPNSEIPSGKHEEDHEGDHEGDHEDESEDS